MKIAVFGLGYVGLANAVLLAMQNEVVGFDIVMEKVVSINNGSCPIEDDDMKDALLSYNLNLVATNDAAMACKKADFIIISTPTNYDPDTNYFDTHSIEATQKTIRKFNKNAYIVIKSTVPIGYTASLMNSTSDDRILFSPEFLREGKALYDNLNPSRIIVGSDQSNIDSVVAAKTFANLLKASSKKNNVPILETSLNEAEAIKLFSNTYLALRISFFNELDTFAETLGFNSKDIIDGMCLDPRIGSNYNNPSFGYGGYCLPKDTKQLLAQFENIPGELASAVVKSNDTRKEYITNKILDLADYPKKNNIIVGVFRVTMKSKSDNFRQSAILDVIQRLKEKNVEILVYEPLLSNESTYQGNKVIHKLDEFKTRSDIIVANRFSSTLNDVKHKVYTRDIFHRD